MLALFLMLAIPLQQPAAAPARATERTAVALPMLRPLGPEMSGLGTVPSSPAFGEAEKRYREQATAWQAEVGAFARGEIQGELPPSPDLEWYPRFRALADAGDLRARVWCLQRVDGCGLAAEFVADYWRGEAYGLATALRAEPELAPALLGAAAGGMPIVGDAGLDAWLAYYGGLSLDETIRRSALARRAAHARMARTPEVAARAAALEDELIERWPDSPEAQRALGKRFSQTNLQIGMIAPEFTGKDVDGREIRLSSYRGKLVVLDFWGFW